MFCGFGLGLGTGAARRSGGVAGQAAQNFIAKLPLSLILGVIFMIIGVVTIWDYFR